MQHNFPDEAIDELQLVLDDFFVFWIDLVGQDGITNYLHMLGAGHFRFFFRRWRNLYRYANQGWEHYNASVKSFFHKRMHRNGFVSHTTISSKIKPIGLWLLHCMMWKTGVAKSYFETLQSIKYDGNKGGDNTQNNDDDNEFI